MSRRRRFGVLLTLAGPQPFHELLDAPQAAGETDGDHEKRLVPVSRARDACQELIAWDAATGKRLWQFQEARSMPRKMAVSAGRVFLYSNDSDAVCLALDRGQELWRKAAPSCSAVTPSGRLPIESVFFRRSSWTAGIRRGKPTSSLLCLRAHHCVTPVSARIRLSPFSPPRIVSDSTGTSCLARSRIRSVR